MRGETLSGEANLNQYAIGKKLGVGSFGKVKLCLSLETEKQFAIKIFKKGVLRKRREFVKQEGGGMKVKDAL